MWLKDGIHAVPLRRFTNVFVTVYSVSVPPDEMLAKDYFPTDILVLHHSPRYLNCHRDTKNWRFWDSGSHIYSNEDDGYWERLWVPPAEKWQDFLTCTYLHVDKPMAGLRRGDVLCLSGREVVIATEDENGELEQASKFTFGFGTTECPFFMVESAHLFRDWPAGRLLGADPLSGLRTYLQAQAPLLLSGGNQAAVQDKSGTSP